MGAIASIVVNLRCGTRLLSITAPYHKLRSLHRPWCRSGSATYASPKCSNSRFLDSDARTRTRKPRVMVWAHVSLG